MSAKPYTLEVAYQTKGEDALVWGEPDPEIEKLVGFGSDGSGTVERTQERDLTFSFATDVAARAAFARVKGQLPVSGKIFDHTGSGELPDMHVL